MRHTNRTNIIVNTVFLPIVLAALLSATIAGCNNADPIVIGFIGGTSGSVADLGISALDAVQMAVRERNEQGGIKGRRIQLVLRDDQQDQAVAKRAALELIEAGVEAIIGPMTSDMAVAIVPVLNDARVVGMSPTVTTEALAGIDDYFFRVTSTTRKYATLSAEYQLESDSMHRVAVAYDENNLMFTSNWLENFRRVFTEGGGEIISTVPFNTHADSSLTRIAVRLLEAEPDGILLIANSMDSALLCQQIRKLDDDVAITLSDWGSTERLLELGGRAIDGTTVVQTFDRENTHPDYQAFRKAYMETYKREPGFPGVNAYDAARIVFAALESRKPGQTVPEAILSAEWYDGLQGQITFDRYGDVDRFSAIIGIILDGQIIVLD